MRKGLSREPCGTVTVQGRRRKRRSLRRLRSGELGQPLISGSKPVTGSKPGKNDQLDRFKVAFVLAYSLMCTQTLNE